MIPEIERKILEKINYANKYLQIREKYTEERTSVWLFKKSDIIKIFDNLKIKVECITGGSYVIERAFKDYLFKYYFVISKNNFNIYLYVYVDNILLEERISNIGALLRYLPYNLELAEKLNCGGLILDSIDKFGNYIKDNIALMDEFVDEYMKILEEKV